MNELLSLKGTFEHGRNNNRPGPSNIPKKQVVTSDHLKKLSSQLVTIKKYWLRDNTIKGALVSVHYNKIVAKSNRISTLLKSRSTENINDFIRGSKFGNIDGKIAHIFTYFVQIDNIDKSIELLNICAKEIDLNYNGQISNKDIEELNISKKDLSLYIKNSRFVNVLCDAFYISHFSVDTNVGEILESSLITLYKTNVSTKELFLKFGIEYYEGNMLDDTTVLLNPNQFKILKEKAPYLIAMQVKDLSKISDDYFESSDLNVLNISDPTNEPIIGVIDTVFSSDVYFSKWVENVKMIDDAIELNSNDYEHGTAVTSIIVDGPSFNPDLQDNCGRFRVKHFGVACGGKFSSLTILKSIREAVAKNPDIKVWNLSLGSAMEINENFVSPEAAELDKIQTEYDVIFIVAGTNKDSQKTNVRIGAPADSLNSIVVNSVKKDNTPASYTRVGPVLSFFHKPDISYYGGDKNEWIHVCSPTGDRLVCGTSFAAPWVTRKVAYLIYKLGFTREIAKALIIDSSAGWNRQDNISHTIGYGVVPKDINSIVKTNDDEIRFIMIGYSESYETYNYNIPVPYSNDKHPFYARATLCYFPTCSRNQGVDYTNTEMDIHFGRIDNNGKVKSINNNNQTLTDTKVLYEKEARKLYRKWDNIKYIGEEVKDIAHPKKKYGAGLWGISIKTKERLSNKMNDSLNFGLVITLKEMNGVNRYDEFIKLCSMRGWLVNKISVDNQIEIFNKSEEEIKFDE